MPWPIGLLLLSVGVVTASDNHNYTCPSCSEDLEFVKMMRINEVKNTILEKLRLSRVPNITSADLEHLPPIDQLISDFGLSSDMYSDQPMEPLGENTYYEDDKFHVNVEQAALFPDTDVNPKYVEIAEWVAPENVFHFKLNAALLTRELRRAEFQFHLSCGVLHDLKSFTAVVETVVRDKDGYRTKKAGAIDVRNHRCGHNGRWIQIEVKKEALAPWFSSLGGEGNSLKFRIYDHTGQEVSLRLPNDGKFRPFLKMVLGDDGKVRKRRYVGINCEHVRPYKECCRYKFEVNFLDYGWEWIIAPRQYEAYYCYGECREMARKKYQPCCTPKSLRSINMLYMTDEKTIHHGNLPGMVVDICSCLA
ncbi:growth/differentiation factor 8-like [Galendromus occidentalis]|uniref:Growth/differentiation factor 8-like n=1 Tax=Galendromus occidentalis TaxID=34638 RepID=A0AAJ7L5V1_9ACAR|nr:growth/differentiation factor 8-like [Galendromus occidentalis]